MNLNYIRRDMLRCTIIVRNNASATRSYFHNIEEELINLIDTSTYVIGCVAWLTNDRILDALSKKIGVKIIINKEEYLRVDTDAGKKFFYKNLRSRYDGLDDWFASVCDFCCGPFGSCAHFNEIFPCIGSTAIPGAILTCGIVNSCSKLHHKFLLLFDEDYNPMGVWTGSYNLSNNSNTCLENAVYITDGGVFNEYLLEFQTVYAYSECYRWESGSVTKSA